MPLVTMFTDASFHQPSGIATWAMWAKLDGKTIRYSGRLKTSVPQIGTAELSAIANGLYCIHRDFSCPPNTKIITQTDSKESIWAITRNHHTRAEDKAIVEHIKSFASINGWKILLRHVKAHKGTSTPRNAVNTWCDKECRRRMGEALGISDQLTLAI